MRLLYLETVCGMEREEEAVGIYLRDEESIVVLDHVMAVAVKVVRVGEHQAGSW